MLLPDYPLLEYEPQYKQEMRPDAPVWWDMDQIIERTAPYCVPVYLIDVSGELAFDYYCLSETSAWDVVMRLKCLN